MGKSDYGNSGNFFAWFLATKIKYSLVINDFGVISAKRTFKGYSAEHRMIGLDLYISLSAGKYVSGKFLMDRTTAFEELKVPHGKKDCLDCDNGKHCSDCVEKREMICFNCDMEIACNTCLDLITQKKTFSTDINMLKRKLQANIIKSFLII